VSNDIVDFATAREAATTKQAPRQPQAESDPVAALAASLEKLAALCVQLGTTVAALEQTILHDQAEIASLKSGFAALTRLLRVGGNQDAG
jgi:hypothetical protein